MGQHPTTDYDEAFFTRELKREIHLSNLRAEKEKAELEMITQARQTTAFVYFLYRATSNLARFLAILTFLNDRTTKFILQTLPWAAIVSMIFSSLLKMITAALISNESTPTRISKIIAATSCLGLGITAIILVGKYISIAALAIDIAHNTWQACELAYKRYIGSGKQKHTEIALLKNQMMTCYKKHLTIEVALTKANSDERNHLNDQSIALEDTILALNKKITLQENQEQQQTHKLAKKIHSAILSTFIMTGFILTTIPITAPIGAAILIGTAIYAVLDTFKINPFKLAANKVFGNLCTHKIPETTFAQLKPELDMKMLCNNKKKVSQSFNTSTKNVFTSIGAREMTAEKNQPTENDNENTTHIKPELDSPNMEKHFPADRTPSPACILF